MKPALQSLGVLATLSSVAVACFLAGTANAQMVSTFEGAPVHEAYLSPVRGAVILEAIDAAPPPPVLERIPPPPDPQLVWIPGYWAWVAQRGDFVWVSGVWRRPPPGRHWVPGAWERVEEGWVWLKGFWSQSPAERLTYINLAPPDPIEENVAEIEDSSYLWLPGYWDYIPETQNYVWRRGQWAKLDPQWVFVPAHYVWRPGGYIFVSAYWDYPIERRGRAYEAVYFPPTVRRYIIYEPVVVVEADAIVRRAFFCYPDYVYFFHHHHSCRPAFWSGYAHTPPWWKWRSWWTLSWHNQWSIWWWYTHPGYPQPVWISEEICRRVTPPPPTLVVQITVVRPPPIVMRDGVVPPSRVLRAATEVREKNKPGRLAAYPVLPSNPKTRDSINILAREPNRPTPQVLLPAGKRTSSNEAVAGEKAAPPKPICAHGTLEVRGFRQGTDEQTRPSLVRTSPSPKPALPAGASTRPPAVRSEATGSVAEEKPQEKKETLAPIQLSGAPPPSVQPRVLEPSTADLSLRGPAKTAEKGAPSLSAVPNWHGNSGAGTTRERGKAPAPTPPPGKPPVIAPAKAPVSQSDETKTVPFPVVSPPKPASHSLESTPSAEAPSTGRKPFFPSFPLPDARPATGNHAAPSPAKPPNSSSDTVRSAEKQDRTLGEPPVVRAPEAKPARQPSPPEQLGLPAADKPGVRCEPTPQSWPLPREIQRSQPPPDPAGPQAQSSAQPAPRPPEPAPQSTPWRDGMGMRLTRPAASPQETQSGRGGRQNAPVPAFSVSAPREPQKESVSDSSVSDPQQVEASSNRGRFPMEQGRTPFSGVKPGRR